MKALGAEIIHTPRKEGMKGAIDRALELEQALTMPIVFYNLKTK